jgi:hypothetical protein
MSHLSITAECIIPMAKRQRLDNMSCFSFRASMGELE